MDAGRHWSVVHGAWRSCRPEPPEHWSARRCGWERSSMVRDALARPWSLVPEQRSPSGAALDA